MRAHVPEGTTFDRLQERYALQRLGEVTEQAQAILFLTGPESNFITGVSLAVDGGRTFH
jgi:NAD(P)-dependent dehydrogenase (short-subunit alcohol dehydrogenase family)